MRQQGVAIYPGQRPISPS